MESGVNVVSHPKIGSVQQKQYQECYYEVEDNVVFPSDTELQIIDQFFLDDQGFAIASFVVYGCIDAYGSLSCVDLRLHYIFSQSSLQSTLIRGRRIQRIRQSSW